MTTTMRCPEAIGIPMLQHAAGIPLRRWWRRRVRIRRGRMKMRTCLVAKETKRKVRCNDAAEHHNDGKDLSASQHSACEKFPEDGNGYTQETYHRLVADRLHKTVKYLSECMGAHPCSTNFLRISLHAPFPLVTHNLQSR
jgi:hypothetical protein